ncbi:MAG: hypothetical protein JXK93_01020 [Sphaerochaetaceae bacterium]|nr:hypothetical protein [Sphaerochaetaceae bacterium]
MKKLYGMTFLLILIGGMLCASAPTFHAGVSTSVGFFSRYASGEVGIKADLSETFAIGLTQRIGYGFTYGEVTGMTELRTYLYEDLFIHIGASYLLKPSSIADPDFNTGVLPHLGFGLYIPLEPARRAYVVPRMEMNQSFYLSDEVRPIYADLPFPIAGQVSLAFEYRTE